jgi:hypothetical protein
LFIFFWIEFSMDKEVNEFLEFYGRLTVQETYNSLEECKDLIDLKGGIIRMEVILLDEVKFNE